MEFSGYWEQEDKQTLRDLPCLTPPEMALYNALRDNKLGDKVRLEQELIGFGWVQLALSRLD
ncbi:hypothetical protein GCM10022212_22420 [Actimicrobium antarcticum]|uniref:Wadjet protein JetD C-terminal domain-containing protein n=1 Tax=Actimicrobium antarcticum TaxID=1051899 RepID=A0ABP7TDA4_9BURK